MYGDAWLDPASCPKKASCLLRPLRWDSGASATLLFVPSVCEMNFGRSVWGRQNHMCLQQLKQSHEQIDSLLRPHHFTLLSRRDIVAFLHLHKNIYLISHLYSVTNRFSSFWFFLFLFFFFSLTSLTSAVWTSAWTTACGTSELRTQSTGSSGSTPLSCTG